jgi:hypothetical protein
MSVEEGESDIRAVDRAALGLNADAERKVLKSAHAIGIFESV